MSVHLAALEALCKGLEIFANDLLTAAAEIKIEAAQGRAQVDQVREEVARLNRAMQHSRGLAFQDPLALSLCAVLHPPESLSKYSPQTAPCAAKPAEPPEAEESPESHQSGHGLRDSASSTLGALDQEYSSADQGPASSPVNQEPEAGR